MTFDIDLILKDKLSFNASLFLATRPLKRLKFTTCSFLPCNVLRVLSRTRLFRKHIYSKKVSLSHPAYAYYRANFFLCALEEITLAS